jgi:hypothetical protein
MHMPWEAQGRVCTCLCGARQVTRSGVHAAGLVRMASSTLVALCVSMAGWWVHSNGRWSPGVGSAR